MTAQCWEKFSWVCQKLSARSAGKATPWKLKLPYTSSVNNFRSLLYSASVHDILEIFPLETCIRKRLFLNGYTYGQLLTENFNIFLDRARRKFWSDLPILKFAYQLFGTKKKQSPLQESNPWSLVWCSGGHGSVDSCQGLRFFFFCSTPVSCWSIHLSQLWNWYKEHCEQDRPLTDYKNGCVECDS